MKKNIAAKGRSLFPVLLAVLLVGLLALTGCQSEPKTQVSSIPIGPFDEEELAPEESAAQSEPEDSSQPEQEPQPPEPQYSEWVLGEWVTEPLEEGDLCHLANTRTQETQNWGPWSEWSVEPVDTSNTREMQTKVEEGPIIDHYIDIPVNDQYGYQTGKTVLRPAYKRDENGYFVMAETTYYRYRDFTVITTTPLYQYETRQITNQAELDSWEEQYGKK